MFFRKLILAFIRRRDRNRYKRCKHYKGVVWSRLD